MGSQEAFQINPQPNHMTDRSVTHLYNKRDAD